MRFCWAGLNFPMLHCHFSAIAQRVPAVTQDTHEDSETNITDVSNVAVACSLLRGTRSNEHPLHAAESYRLRNVLSMPHTTIGGYLKKLELLE